MTIINKKICGISENGRELCTEASMASLAPGEWPDFISVVDDEGEGFLFMRSRPLVAGGGLAAYRYESRDGFGLLVIND